MSQAHNQHLNADHAPERLTSGKKLYPMTLYITMI